MGAAQVNIAATLTMLKQQLGERLSTVAAVRERHGQDESYHAMHAPDAVVFPKTTEEVAEIVRVCAGYGTPVVPFGVGTSLEGHVAALRGGVCIDCSEMNEIVRVSAEDMDVTVQAGVRRKQLNEHLRDTGLFFPIDPGADATIGGMTATRASGTNAVRYGTMSENVISLTVVTSDGRIINTARRARKSAAGYDLTRMFIGSEGTLGVITEITLRLYGIPEAMSAAVCSFPGIDAAIETVIETIQMGIPVARIELLDELQMKACNLYSDLNYPEAPTLFIEFHGSPASVAEQAETVQMIAAECGAGDFQWATQTEDRNELWQARHDAAYAALALRPGSKMWATDVCVPISRLAECILETQKDISESFLIAPLVGHVGDGNFHLLFLFNPDDEREMAEVERLNKRLVLRALALDGTCTGEHGVGTGKLNYLIAEHGEAVGLMREIKKAMDPANIMNPGKIIQL